MEFQLHNRKNANKIKQLGYWTVRALKLFFILYEFYTVDCNTKSFQAVSFLAQRWSRNSTEEKNLGV